MLGGVELWIYKTVTNLLADRIVKKLQTKWHKNNISVDRFEERLGIASAQRSPGKFILLYARDVNAALPLFSIIEQLNEHELDLHFLVTTRKQEDIGVLLDRLPDNTTHQFAPIDTHKTLHPFINHWKPDIVIIAGSEFWPGLLSALSSKGIPLIAVNTKMTDRTFRRWRWVSGSAKKLLNCFSLILVQDKQVSGKLKRLGARDGNLRVTGFITDTKKLLNFDESLYSRLSAAIGSRSVWLAATTHRNEEDVVINAHKIALRRNRRLMLILQTQEKQRSQLIAARHENKNLNFVFEENGDTPSDNTDVFITDQLENLGTYLRLAPVTFCGGTLSKGHTIDPFHPASMGSAILHGPICGDFKLEFDRYREANAARLVSNGNELAQNLNEVIAPDIAASMAHEAWRISSEGGEVSGIVILEILEKLVEKVPDHETA